MVFNYESKHIEKRKELKMNSKKKKIKKKSKTSCDSNQGSNFACH